MNSATNDTRRFPLRARGVRGLLALLVVAAAAGLWHTQSAAAAGVTVNLTPTVSGRSVTLTADILGLPVLDTTGTLSFYESGTAKALNLGTAVFPTGPLADQSGSFTLANVSPGTHTYYVVYKASFAVSLQIGGISFPSPNATVDVVNTSPPPAFTTNVTLTSDATSPVDPSQTVTFTATVTRVPSLNGTPVGGTVAFNDLGSGSAVAVTNDISTDYGEKVPVDAQGVATISVQLPASPSPHLIVASYSGSATDAPAPNTTPLPISTKDANPVTTTTHVVPSPTSIVAGDAVTITATLDISGNAPTPPTGNVTFSATSSTGGSVNLPSVPIGSSMDADGNLSPAPAANVAVLQAPSWTVGDFTIVAAYSGNYPGSRGTASLSVASSRAATELAYTGVTTVEYGHTAALSAIVTDQSQSGAPLAGRTVTFTVGAQSCSGVSTSTGLASCPLVVTQDVGTPGVTASVAQDGTTSAKTVQATFAITPQPTTLTTSYAAGTDFATLSATLLGDLGTGVPNQTVSLTLGGEPCTATTGRDGKGSCPVPAITGTATATLDGAFAGSANGDYRASTAATHVVQLVVDTNLAYTGDTTATYGGPTTFSATLTQAGGAPLAGRSVTFTLGGQTCVATTDANGLVTCTLANVTQPAGAAAVVASYAGDTATNPTSVSTPFTVIPPTTAVTITYLGATGGDYSDMVRAAAQITGADGHSVPDNEAVIFTLGSQTCIGYTLFGYAACPVSVQEPAGATTVTAAYGGDSTYASATKSVPFTVRHEDAVVHVTTGPVLAGSSAALGATLLEDGVRPIAGRTLTLTLGSQSCTAVTDATGAAGCSFTAPTTLGPVPATASFAGDAYYDPGSDPAQTIVYAYAPGGGSFVIGDRSMTGTVTFWGSQWAKQNSLSGGSAPSAFKGFALHGTAQCGGAWSTDPGNSSPPPSGPLPSYMAVLVASGSSKSGSTISGNTVSIVVVKTNSGYAPNPGHAGTGTVVAMICSA